MQMRLGVLGAIYEERANDSQIQQAIGTFLVGESPVTRLGLIPAASPAQSQGYRNVCMYLLLRYGV